jgi:hypothetical protein
MAWLSQTLFIDFADKNTHRLVDLLLAVHEDDDAEGSQCRRG